MAVVGGCVEAGDALEVEAGADESGFVVEEDAEVEAEETFGVEVGAGGIEACEEVGRVLRAWRAPDARARVAGCAEVGALGA